jgi:hypothetical protein
MSKLTKKELGWIVTCIENTELYMKDDNEIGKFNNTLKILEKLIKKIRKLEKE